MTIGISKERLIEIARQTHDSDDTNHIVLSLFDYLINGCAELDPWLPIESAPWKKPLLVYYPTMEEGLRQRVICRRVDWDASLHKPTHYKLLPRQPE